MSTPTEFSTHLLSAPTDAERELGRCLDRALGRWLRWNIRQSPIRFGPGVLSALGTVVDAGSIRLGDLAAREGITPASLTRSVAILEENQLLERTVDPRDRRSVFVHATTAGQDLIHEGRRQRGDRLAERLSPLTPDQVQAMHTVVRAMDALTSSPGPPIGLTARP